jgi:Dullard-like phosphatase family protein
MKEVFPTLRMSVKTPKNRGSSSRALHDSYKRPTAPFKDDHLLPPFHTLRPGRGRNAAQQTDKSQLKCLVLDLDETLIHSSFEPIEVYDYIVEFDVEDVPYTCYVSKRPGVEEFMRRMAALYEIVVFTASLPNYANPVIDRMMEDVDLYVDWRLYRESCTFQNQTYVKDLSRLGRELNKTLIVDNSPHSFAFQPENAIHCDSWFDDQTDTELFDLVPILEGLADSSIMNIIDELEKLHINGVSSLNMNDGDDNYCPYCDSVLLYPSQKYCCSCGTNLHPEEGDQEYVGNEEEVQQYLQERLQVQEGEETQGNDAVLSALRLQQKQLEDEVEQLLNAQ